MRVIATRLFPPLALVSLVVAGWELWVRGADVDRAVFAPPSAVAAALVDQAGTLVDHAATTLAETGLGLCAGLVLGLLVATTIASWTWARHALEPALVALQTIPPIVIAPILVLALGYGWAPRVVVVTIVVFFPLAIAASGAFLHTDHSRIDLVRAFGATRGQMLRHVVIPGSMPAIFAGLRIGAAYAVGSAAVAEQIGGARAGLGLFIARSQRNFRSDQVLAGVVVIVILSIAVYGLVGWIGHLLTPWARPAKELSPS